MRIFKECEFERFFEIILNYYAFPTIHSKGTYQSCLITLEKNVLFLFKGEKDGAHQSSSKFIYYFIRRLNFFEQ
jgi:hypothetical protein